MGILSCAVVSPDSANWPPLCHINQARYDFRELNLDPDRYYTSVRFNDDETVLGRIRSAVTDEAEFQTNPKAWIMDALRDCASADHWYTFEKEW